MDFNFFENIKKEKKRSGGGTSLTRLLLLAVIVCGGGALLLFTAFAVLDYMDLTSEEKSLQASLNDPNFIQGIAKADEMEAELSAISSIARQFLVSDDAARSLNTATIDLVNTISGEMPHYLSLTSISITGGSVALNGEAYSLVTIAQYEKNLRNTRLFSEIVVNTMAHDYTFLDETLQADGEPALPLYTFDVQLTLRGTPPRDEAESIDAENANALDEEETSI